MPDLQEITDLATGYIRRFEGCRLEAYPDPASGGDPWTIGYGATGHDIRKGTIWTQGQADADLAQRVERLVRQLLDAVTVELPDRSYAALVSLAYNIGITAELHSTLLRKLNAGDYHGAAEQFLAWDRAAGKVNPGLQKRRAQEREAFLDGLSQAGLAA